ncbi:MAG: hypothetical protein EZS28_011066 [Streblomastix strix]|uniref:Uncharacterized protein n=1 Tax=Streblomastix strix TaxID=222440 RepID=A0A5J4WFB3_9EUKA|nr:MAG: hypothetical protein EZS28_011066 [Streblomastix strix]
MRPPTLVQIMYLISRLIANYQFVAPLSHINLPNTAQPMWKDDSHVSTDREVILTLLKRTMKYFNQLHMLVHYGPSKYSFLDDSTMNSIQTTRLSQKQNSQLLFSQADCYTTSVNCDQAPPNRIFQMDPPFFGLSQFISRTTLLIDHLMEQNPQTFNEKMNEVRYVTSAVRYDMREVTLIFNSLMWAFDMQSESDRSLRLLDLIPVDENEKKMILLPSMRSGIDKIDSTREIIMHYGQELIDTMNGNGNMNDIMQHYKTLMISVFRSFQDQEKDMEELKYDEELTNIHKQDHLLVRQRLTALGDNLRLLEGKRESIRETVIRALSRLFDVHFLGDDVKYSQFVLCKDEQLRKKIGKENAEDQQDGQIDSNNNSPMDSSSTH